MKDTKFELLESINILAELAERGNEMLPGEICRFLSDEFNLSYSIIAAENAKNSFKIIGKSIGADEALFNKVISIDDYSKIEESTKYENEFITECQIKSLQSIDTQIHLLHFANSSNFLIISKHKFSPIDKEKRIFSEIAKFVKDMLKIWQNHPDSNSNYTSLKSPDFFIKSTKGLEKEIKTINGLLTLVKEEIVSNSVKQYIYEIRSTQNNILVSLSDLEKIINLESDREPKSESIFKISDLVKNISAKIKLENPKLNIELTSNNNDEISYDQKIFESIFENALEFFNAVTPSNKLTVHHYITTDNKLRISISTKSINLSKADISKIGEPFSTNFSPMKISGLKMNLLLKQIEKNYGKYKFDDNGSEFSMNFSLPISKIKLDANNLFASNDSDNDKDKILVIESDNASTSLLNNYLSKWNYAAHIVSSGNLALSLLKEKKYVAVILNIEQGNENSLELLQKIKNNKSTRNVPVIVFSVEPEKEKIYLMGSVDYLVKPINYNNLVEILTSYKLRRNSTVLCVDDDQPTLKLVKQAVQTAGFNVIADYRPEIVLDLISDKDLDLAIIDLDMPKLNGFDLIKAIKSQDKFSKLPIIIYTGKEDYQDDLQKIDGMFTDLLDKSSTSFNDLEKTISAMIKSYEEPKIISESSEPPTGPKILMAEDYKHSQIIVTRLLKKSGFENIIVVENGEEALNICEKDKIDLVLMDMQMPVMNGFEATGKIRDLEGYADVPIIALTAFAMKGDREKCLEAGATDYIPKPIDSKEFIEKVKYYTQVEAQA